MKKIDCIDNAISCTTDKDLYVVYLDLRFLSHPGPDKNIVNIMPWLYRKSHCQVTLVLTANDIIKTEK